MVFLSFLVTFVSNPLSRDHKVIGSEGGKSLKTLFLVVFSGFLDLKTAPNPYSPQSDLRSVPGHPLGHCFSGFSHRGHTLPLNHGKTTVLAVLDSLVNSGPEWFRWFTN